MADFKNWGIWQSAWIKNLSFLFGGAKRNQEVLMLGEGGTLAIEHMPMATGFCSVVVRHMSWLVVHKLSGIVKETGHTILEVTERSYMPTDPFERFTEEEKKKIQPLENVAFTRCIEKINSLVSGATQSSSTKAKMIWACFFIIVIILVFSL